MEDENKIVIDDIEITDEELENLSDEELTEAIEELENLNDEINEKLKDLRNSK